MFLTHSNSFMPSVPTEGTLTNSKRPGKRSHYSLLAMNKISENIMQNQIKRLLKLKPDLAPTS